MGQLHRMERGHVRLAKAYSDDRYGYRAEAHRAGRRLSRAIVANDVAEMPSEFDLMADAWERCDCAYCDGAAVTAGCNRMTSEDPGGRRRA